MNKREKINAFLQKKGYDLKEIGIKSRAFTKQEAIEVVEYYQQTGVAILGGDVLYLDQKGKINYTYDNWYFDKTKEENDEEYLKRSIIGTKNYINKYTNESFKNVIFLFDIVFDRHLII